MPLRIIHLIKVERDSLREVAQSFVDGAALAGHIDLKALRYVPVFFLVYRGGQGATRGHSFSVTPNGLVVVPAQGATSRGPETAGCRPS